MKRKKPSWTTAPSWASWLVQDRSGIWWWHEEKPISNSHTHANSWSLIKYSRFKIAGYGEYNDMWDTTLEARNTGED